MSTVGSVFSIEQAAKSMALTDWLTTPPPHEIRLRQCKSRKWTRRRNKAYERWNEQTMRESLSRASTYAEMFDMILSKLFAR